MGSAMSSCVYKVERFVMFKCSMHILFHNNGVNDIPTLCACACMHACVFVFVCVNGVHATTSMFVAADSS